MLSAIRKNTLNGSLFLALAAALYILSLTQDSYCTRGCSPGFLSLLTGWLGLFLEAGMLFDKAGVLIKEGEIAFDLRSGATLTWLANPLLIAAGIHFNKRPKRALSLASIAFLLMLSFLIFKFILANEAGHYARIQSSGTGYWLWLSSAVVLFIGIRLKQIKTTNS